jgi:hypothetical protein
MRKVSGAALIVAWSLCALACSRQGSPSNLAGPQAGHAARSRVAKVPSVSAVAVRPAEKLPASPSPSAAPSPAVSIARAPLGRKTRVPRLPPDALPKILAVDVSETTVKPGDTVSGSVVTSSNVASVQARIGGYALSLAKTGVGRFSLTYTVTPLPWFVRGNFTMQVIARNTRGDTAERAIPLIVRQ